MKRARNWWSRYCCTTVNWPSKIDSLDVLQKKDVMYIKHILYWKDFMKINAWSVTKPRDCFWITDSFLAHINICSVRNQSNHTSDKVRPYFLHLGTVKGLNFHQWIRLRQPGGIKIFPINCLYLLSRNKRPFDVSWSINGICFEWHIYQLFTDKLIHFISLSLSQKASSS